MVNCDALSSKALSVLLILDFFKADEGIKDYFLFYNTKRTHQSLAKQTPDEVYSQDNGLKEAA